ncbi:MAG: chromosome segregation protein SMC [Candidatus Aenigmarchaeota archaeon]|nr:chromosome segregation protein SMC [Candidatus Aenigmarchaeota archaeon]
MTRLDRITMQGFKSFANRVTIPFPAGFSAIAGPNGSGKSNCVDALTFVLGTTSARSIRAQKLQNLIFNGGRNRKPAEFCEVSIYLDNSDGKIPLPEKEIKITRRVTRSGVSVYKINGHTVTRTKILDIFSQTGLSADGYNIIMQGDVTRIIEMSNAERKETIDDISGISEFNEKKDKAAAEMEKVEIRVRENMIVVAEKQRLVSRLKEEKENAEKYVKLESELRKSKASLVKKRLDEAEEKMSVLDREIDEDVKVFDKLENEFSAIDADLEKKEKTLMKRGEQIIEKSRNIEILRKIDSIQTEIVRKKDKIDFNERETERLKSISAAAERNLAVREVLNMGHADVHGTVNSLVKIPKRYAVALEVAIGRHSSDLVVANEDTASFCIRALKDKRIGRARFLPLAKMKQYDKKPYKNRDVIGYAIDLIEYDRRYDPAMQYVLGSTLVVDNIDIAKRIRNFRVVTLDGDLVEVSGAMIGGFYKKRKGAQGFSSEITQLDEENRKLQQEIEKSEKELEKLKARQEEETEEVTRLQEARTKEEQELGEMRQRRKELYEERLVLQGKISRMKIDKARLEANLDNLKIEFEDYREVRGFFDQSQEELQERVRRLLIEINKLGPVNMKAIEEFQTINVEFEELKRKLDRLLEEKEAVMNVVREIETKRYDKFMETFGSINQNFARIYSDLTGGSGELRLEIENNIDSGLIITANPSGKKILNIDSMSGGEKTMASLSFLFAIMQHYASPFYVLDEIDAALDKANTKKVANVIKKYSKNVQFIVITHNDFTIAEADTVFGISMEDGVSRVFGIDMSKG